MNSENEKKWFVYVGDHHEGPFTPREVHEKHKLGIISKESYVWCEGMADWLMLSEVKELSQELKRLEVEDTAAETPALKRVTDPKPLKTTPETRTPTKQAAGKQSIKKPVEKNSAAAIIATLSLVGLLFLGIGGLALTSRMVGEDLHSKLRPVLTRITDQVPAAAPLFKLIPHLPDVNPDEFRELEAARMGAPESGVRIAVASSLNDANRPVFYISTNLPDHTKFDLYLVGSSETLLNRLQFSTQNTVTTVRGFGKSETFLAEGGQLIPKGEYHLYVTESQDQSEPVKLALLNYVAVKSTVKTPVQIPISSHFLITKVYFLGGSRDAVYLSRLKAFHEKIKQNSQRELQELKQYSDTLNMQFSALTTEFNKIHQSRKPTPGLRAAWKKNATTWAQINGQLDQTIQTWSKDTLKNEFFYGKIYELVKSAYESVKALFEIENNFIETNPDRGGFEIAHGKALSEARESLELLSTKMNLMMSAPNTPNGIPTRDGL